MRVTTSGVAQAGTLASMVPVGGVIALPVLVEGVLRRYRLVRVRHRRWVRRGGLDWLCLGVADEAEATFTLEFRPAHRVQVVPGDTTAVVAYQRTNRPTRFYATTRSRAVCLLCGHTEPGAAPMESHLQSRHR